jgi:hypothetical protein
VHKIIEKDRQPGKIPAVFEKGEHEIETDQIGEYYPERNKKAGGEDTKGLLEINGTID